MRRAPHALSLTQQAMRIVGTWPNQPRPHIHRSKLFWTGHLQPTPISPTYTMSLTYKQYDMPRVQVVAPTLDPGLRKALPHMYKGDVLCLYSDGDWKASMHIAHTIIPWTSEWLFHYEAWRATGNWQGGGG